MGFLHRAFSQLCEAKWKGHLSYTRSPYVDTRPNLEEGVAEKREYYAFFIVADEQVGTKSATVSITV